MAFVLIIGIMASCITTTAVFAENEDNVIKFFDSKSGMGKVSGGKTAAYDKEHTEVYVAEPGNTLYFYADNTSTVAADIISFDFCENNTGVFGYFELFDPVIDESKSYFERFKRTVFLSEQKFMYFTRVDSGGASDSCKNKAPIITPGEWNHADICIDYTERSATIYYNGKYQSEMVLPESYVSCGGIRYVNENKGTESVVYLDNIRMNHIKQKGVEFELDPDITYPETLKAFVDITNENLGSIFFDSKIKYNLEFTNNYNKNADYKVTVNVIDENKHIEQTFEKETSCEAMDKSDIPLEFEVKDKGFYTLELNIYNSVTGKSIVEKKEFSYATLNEEPNEKYGVCNHFNQGHGIDEADRKTELFAKAGFSMLRDDPNWVDVEKTEGVLELPETEVIKRNAEDKYGMGEYVVLLGGNPQITGENTPRSPEAIKKFADYAGFMAENNKDRKACYEVWNEYNHTPFNKDNGTVSDYINLLKATYTKIKSIDPDATVYGMGGVTYITNFYDWIEEFLQLGGQQYCDGFSFHPYTPSGTAVTAMDVFNKCYELFEKYGCEDKKLSLSEMGWSKNDEIQQQQADYEIQFATMANDKIDNIMWYVSQMKQSSEGENNFGMIRAWTKKWAAPYEPYSARPVFLAHANYNKLMNKATDKREITSSDSDISAFMYKTNDGKNMIICWNNANSQKDVSIKLNTDKVSVYNINGVQNDYTLVNNTISVTLDNSPKYIKGDFSDAEFVDEQMFSISTKAIETTLDDKITLSLANKSGADAQIEIETPINITVEKNDGFANNNAEIVLSTGNTKIEDSAVKIKILSNGNLIKEYIVPITYKDTASASVLASYFRSGRWQYNVRVTNNKTTENISGKVIVSKPDNIPISERTIEFSDILPMASKNLYINIPSNLVDVKTEFDGMVILSNGEEYPLVSDIYFSSIVYTDKQPKIDGVIDKDEWFTEAPFKLIYKSQVVNIEDWKGVDDVGGNAYCMYDKNSFYICAEITDNILGDNDEYKRIWANDSIQFAFAPERVKNGIRTEYGIGLVEGEPKIERYSFVTVNTGILGVQDKNDFSAIQYAVRRDEENKKTIYEARIPWTEIYGSDFNIFRYDSLYFSMLVNDNDKEGRRGWIEFCPGIGESKDPSQFIDVPLLKKGRMIKVNKKR